MREQARNLTERSCVSQHGPSAGVTSWQNGRLKVKFGPFEVEKVTAEYVACDLMVRLYFISI